MHPTTIILESSKLQQQKTLLLRNTTKDDMILKLYANSDSLRLDRKCLTLEAGRMTRVSACFTTKDEGYCAVPARLEISIFARPVTADNLYELRTWVQNNGEEKRLHLAFKLSAVVRDGVYSAEDIVLDLPGNAVEIGQFDESEADVMTADQLVREKKNNSMTSFKENREESCGLLKKWMNTIYPPAKNTRI